MKNILLTFLNFYKRFISPLTGSACRFHPTCSAYATEAITRHGTFRGSLLTIWRLLRCHPWSGADPIDPVPSSFTLCGCRAKVRKGDPERGPV